MEVLHTPPSTSQFTSLAEHQSQTPLTFYSSTPVLHHHSPGTTLYIHDTPDLSSSPLSRLIPAPPLSTPSTNGTSHSTPIQYTTETNGDTVHTPEIVVQGIDVWITSSTFLLYSPSLSAGISIPYPSISLHGIQRHLSSRQGLYMELDTSDGYDDFDGSGIIAMTIIPLSSEERTAGEGQNAEEREDRDGDEEVKEIFKSLSACADLHPDPVSGSEDGMEIEGDGGGEPYISMRESGIDGLPPPIPGSGGWITAENVGNFFDEEGNFRGRALGQGAGNVRERDGEGDVDDGGDGEGLGPDEEVKRRRVE